jgi:hypothetical protein
MRFAANKRPCATNDVVLFVVKTEFPDGEQLNEGRVLLKKV